MAPGLSYLLTWQLVLETRCQAFFFFFLFFFANISVSQLVCEFLQEGIVKTVLAAKLSIWDFTCVQERRQSE